MRRCAPPSPRQSICEAGGVRGVCTRPAPSLSTMVSHCRREYAAMCRSNVSQRAGEERTQCTHRP
ncbi:hypothetical protein HaLaN_06370 [Haematococcus lacustris]|uniref:Uncharacterized protein n=1 Tax=Haematococcus lacustris TaxID=44745 RepID=A0A699YN37_HAELA|nr:hypothetical protein HaLaN_06370 [Haematococcus lacustris]